MTVLGAADDRVEVVGGGWDAGRAGAGGGRRLHRAAPRPHPCASRPGCPYIGPNIITRGLNAVELTPPGDPVAPIQATDPTAPSSAGPSTTPPARSPSTPQGVVRAAGGVINFEQQPQIPIRVTVEDDTGLRTSRDLVVDVTNVDEPPVFAAGAPVAFTLEEGIATGRVLHRYLATDPEGLDVHFELVDPSGAFALGADGTLRVADGTALDFERAPTVDLTLRALDPGGNFNDLAVRVAVTDQPEMVWTGTFTFSSRGQGLFGGVGNDTFPMPVQSIVMVGDGQDKVADLGVLKIGGALGGSVGVTFDGTYTSGHLIVDWPVEVEVIVADNLVPGQPTTLAAQFRPAPGARMLAVMPYYSIYVRMFLQQFLTRFLACLPSGIFPPGSAIANLPVPGVNPFGLPARSCRAVQVGPRNDQLFQRLFAALPEPARTGTLSADGRRLSGGPWTQTYLNESIPWDDYLSYILQRTGLPIPIIFNIPTAGPRAGFNGPAVPSSTVVGNRASFAVGPATLNAAFWGLDLIGSIGQRFTVDADLRNLNGHLVLEDGTAIDFALGTEVDLVLPPGADRNGDGRVDAELTVSMDAQVTNNREWLVTMGARWIAAYAVLQPLQAGAAPLESGPLVDLQGFLEQPFQAPLSFPLRTQPMRLKIPLQLRP
ncbi:MAG: cadherin repeat domain-containing protein [bacterium]